MARLLYARPGAVDGEGNLLGFHAQEGSQEAQNLLADGFLVIEIEDAPAEETAPVVAIVESTPPAPDSQGDESKSEDAPAEETAPPTKKGK